MTKELQDDIIKIFKRYTSLIEKYIAKMEKSETINDDEIEKINEGIRMFHQLAATIWKLNACNN